MASGLSIKKVLSLLAGFFVDEARFVTLEVVAAVAGLADSSAFFCSTSFLGFWV
jgi:hypothetical protein